MNLEAFRERVYQLYRRVLIYDGRKPTQQDLADALGLSRGELSRRLHGYGTSKLTHQDIHTIIRTLVSWEAISSQIEALELFNLAACPPPTAAEWQVPPLDQLEAGNLVNASAPGQALPPKVDLPLPLTSFVGRDANIAEIGQLLSEARLVTLTGAGGAGKTRLALELGRQLSNQFPDGVRQVELAGMRDAQLLTAWLASAFDVSEQNTQPLLTSLSNYLQPRRLLLILDNCEHLVDAVAALVNHLLNAAPRLVILTTSREGLRVAGEVLYPVPLLSLPEPGRKLTPSQLARCEAIRLFIERARLVEHRFELNQTNAAAIRRICERLDGLPLAIELAAARLAVLSVEQLAERMADDCFPLLTMGSRTALPHHQTLRASLDWSYDLLSDAERLVFAQLSLFAASFSLAAAEKVCAEDTQTNFLDQLGSLVQKSLLIKEEQHNQARYHMLETIRQYAAARLPQLDAMGKVRARYICYYRQIAQEGGAALVGSEQARWLTLLTEEQDNLRYAISLILEERDGEAALEITGALMHFWLTKGNLTEGRSWLTAALAVAGDAPTDGRAKALRGAGAIALRQGDLIAARTLTEQSLTIERSRGDSLGIARAINNLAIITMQQGDYETAKRLYEESLALKRARSDDHGIAVALMNLGNLAYAQSDFTAARSYIEQCAELMHASGDNQGVADAYGNLGNIMLRLGQWREARRLYEQVIEIKSELADSIGVATWTTNLADVMVYQGEYGRAYALYRQSLSVQHEMAHRAGITTALEGLALLALRQGEAIRSTRLYAATHAARDLLLQPVPMSERASMEANLAQLRQELGTDEFTTQWELGAQLSLSQAVDYALTHSRLAYCLFPTITLQGPGAYKPGLLSWQIHPPPQIVISLQKCHINPAFRLQKRTISSPALIRMVAIAL